MSEFAPIPVETERIGKLVLDAAFHVHSELGPGLLESAYEACLSYELATLGIAHQRQMAIPIAYRGVNVDAGFRLDLFVADAVIIELKAVEEFHPIHAVQLTTYLKLTGCRLGYLLNFNVKSLKDGIKRIVR